jgi:ribosomal protein L7/L12
MTSLLKCPACGAPLQISATAQSALTCPFCGNTVVLPEELRGSAPQTQISAPPGVDTAEILRLMRLNKKLDAIKLYRAQTLVGLDEAKAAVERILASGR